MRGAPIPTATRATVLDRPDHRVPEVRPRQLNPEEVRVLNREIATDPRLRAVDRCFERWAITPGVDHWPGLVQPVLLHRASQSKPSPLDDAESKIVDAAVKTSPAWAKRFIYIWYRTDMSVAEIAQTLSMKRYEHVHGERHIVLGYYMGRLAEATILHLKG
jgi:hypothetical protein